MAKDYVHGKNELLYYFVPMLFIIVPTYNQWADAFIP